MKRINQYQKLFAVEKTYTLKELKSTYRKLVKEWHPDKFQDGDALKEEAAIKSREIIDAYHFLVSMAAETKEANLDAYTTTTITSGIEDYQHQGRTLEITFLDGSTYEYFGVDKKLFIKMNQSDKLNRFAKRNIFNSFPYRKSKRDLVKA